MNPTSTKGVNGYGRWDEMTMSTNSMVNYTMRGMTSDKHRKYEVPIENIEIYYMGNGEFVKRLLRM